jgi:type IV pilus assembly protein PilN
VKPIHLNLATRPFEDKRLFVATVVATGVLIAALAYFNFDTYLRYTSQTQSTRATIAKLDAQTEQEQRRAQVVTQQLRSIDISGLAQQTAFINAQIAERAFSWSELLDNLEDVLADDVRITSIAPSFRPDGIVHLELACEAKTSEGLVNMLNRFNAHPRFSNPFPSVESNNNGTYHLQYSVDYKPSDLKVVSQ